MHTSEIIRRIGLILLGSILLITRSETSFSTKPGPFLVQELTKRGERDIAHAIMNGDDAPGDQRPITAPTSATVPRNEGATCDGILENVREVREQKGEGFDPTNGAMNFNSRNTDSSAPFYGLPIQTHIGPASNSYTGGGLNATGVLANTYGGNY